MPENKHKIPFYHKIVFKVFVLSFVVLFSALGINLALTNKMIEQRMEQRLTSDFDSGYHITINFINMVSQLSQLWAKEIVANHLNSEQIKQKTASELNAILQAEKNKLSTDSVILLDAQGTILAQSGSDYSIGDSLQYSDIYKNTIKTNSTTTKIAREQESFIIYSSAIIHKHDITQAILLVGNMINDIFIENIKKNTSLEIAFIGNSAIMSSSQWGTADNLSILPISYIDYQNLLNSPGMIKEVSYKNKTYMVHAKKIENIESLISGSILFGYPYDKIKQEKNNLLNNKLIVSFFSLLFALLLIYFLARKYLITISKLTQAMNTNVSVGNNYQTISINTHDEFELLAKSFNNMGNELNNLHYNLEKEIEKKTQQLQDLNNNLQSLVIDEVEKNREKEQQLIQQSRLAQMGEMISMIAHQWRQPLTAISSSSAAISLKVKLNKLDDTDALELSEKISEYSRHLSSTIDDFRNFFKPNKEKKETNYTELTQGALSIIALSISNRNIKLITRLNSNKKITSYPNEIKQVILNLIKNAEDVLLEKEIQDPQIVIESNNGILTIADNGGGIPDDHMEKIFQPYFSTKTQKDGTGLGLYMSKIIIEKHCGGKLSVSNNQYGAVFKIDLL